MSSRPFVSTLQAADAVSKRVYILLMMFFVVMGLGATGVIATQVSYNWQPSWMLFVPTFVAALLGVAIAGRSRNWRVSLFGYAIIVVPFGLLVGPYIGSFDDSSVLRVLGTTTVVAVCIGLAGALYPKSVESWGGFLFVALLVLIFGDFFRIGMTLFGAAASDMKLWDWVGVLLFTGYIFYDMNKAMSLDYTIDNAVDMAVSLYLDILNLFLRLLGASGTKKS